MSGPSAERRTALLEEVLLSVDSRLAQGLRAQLSAPAPAPQRVAPLQTVALAGHRAAGKTRLLPLLSELLGRPGVDLDVQLEQQHGRSLREWVASDPAGFRAAERAAFQALPAGSLVALGGGFLSLHADLLAGVYTVLVPVSFETYCERLRADTQRPRLRPELTLEEELREVYQAREALHVRVPTIPLVEALRALG
jgi:shikimate kinase